MNKEYDFEKIGKKTPYPVPDGFFDAITNQTLEKAKKRERQLKTRKLIFAWSAAASVLVIVSIAILFSTRSHYGEQSNLSVIRPTETIIGIDSASKVENEIQAEQKNADTKPEFEPVPGNSSETLDDLLAEMDETELLQMAELLSGELFIDELAND